MHKPKTGALTQSYTYDACGNRATMTVTGTESYAVSYAYDANNRLLTEQKTQGLLTDLTTYTYDANGNLLSKAVLAGNGGAAGSTYVYNTLNQLVSATENQRTAAYAYNTQGIRTAKVTFSTRTNYLLDGANVVGERLNGEYVSYLRGANLISRTGEDGTDYYLFNAHGDVTGLADSTGTNTRTYDYDAFGVEKNSDPQDENPFRYCGEYFDGETETYYLRARYYDPTIGRFTQQDTHWTTANSIYGDNPQKINEREDRLGLKSYSYAPQITAVMQSGNLYVYCGNSPINYTDPNGSEWYHWLIGGLIVAAATAAVIITAGGAIPALYAVSAVACGTTAATTASTIAAGAFIGSAFMYGTAVLSADIQSIDSFNASADWSTVASTVGGFGAGAVYGGILEITYFRNNIHFDAKKLQHEYKHAADYGITGNWNRTNATAFEQAIRNQVQTVNKPIWGTYRGTISVLHFYDPKTGIDAMFDLNGNFIASWKLSQAQIEYLLSSGNVQ